MPSRLSLWAASVVESCWLAALLATPAFYNVYSHESFEPDKVFLLRSLTALMLAAGFVWCLENGCAAWAIADRPVWRVPLVKPICALTLAYLLATACSVAPHLSLWGSYQRAQGMYTWGSYVTVFLAIVLVAREHDRWERIVTVVLLASVPVALYAIVQHFNADPIDWRLAPSARATSTPGNPIFAGAFLIMVVPLTLARILARQATSAEEPRLSATHLVRTGPYVVLLGLQVLALYYTESRGPTIGLAFGLAAFAALAAWLRRVRWPVFACGGMAAIAVLVVISSGPTNEIRPRSGFERLRRMFPSQEASGRVRVLIWEGVIDLLHRDAVRTVIGHGPETMLLAFAPVYPAELASYETPEVAPDRAHNEVLDALVTIGAIGCVAELLVFGALVFHILRWLGVIATDGERSWFLATALSGAAVGGLTPMALGRGAFAGIGLSLGLAAGILAYLAGAATRRVKRAVILLDADGMLLAALCAAAIGHFVELQLGIGTSSTRLYFCAFAGLAVAVGLQAPAAATRNAIPQPLALAVMVAWLLILLTIDFYTTTVRLAESTLPLAVIFGATWLFGGMLVTQRSRHLQPRAVGTYAAVSSALWLAFIAVFAPWIESTRALTMRPTSVEEMGSRLADTVSFAYVAAGVCVTLLSVVLARQHRGEQRIRWQTVAAVVAGVGAAAAGVVVNLQLSRADCWAKLGSMYEHQGVWSSAVVAHERALHTTPWRQEYAVNLARALIGRARAVAQQDAAQRDADAAHAIQAMEAAARANPLNPDHPSNLARLYRKWARIGEATSRTERLERADAAYRQALALWPNNPALWNEVALLYLERGQPQQMLETFAASLRLNDRFADTYVRRAQVFVAWQRFDDAVADYRRARRWDSTLAYSPEHLAQVYRDTGQVERALAEAQAGLASTVPGERQLLQELIGTLEKMRARMAAGS